MNSTAKDLLFSRGYYVGNTTDIFSNSAQVKHIMEKTFEMSEPSVRANYFHYRLDLAGQPYSPHSTNVKVEDVKQRLAAAANRKQAATQRWYETNNFGQYTYLYDTVQENVHKLVSRFYTEVNPEHIKVQTNLTLYEDGDFIQPHSDGQNEGRLCIVLVYFSDPEKYIDGGGKLIITDSKAYEEVEPTLGKYVILEFTKNNIRHAVEPVKNGFRRLCYLSIVTERKNG